MAADIEERARVAIEAAQAAGRLASVRPPNVWDPDFDVGEALQPAVSRFAKCIPKPDAAAVDALAAPATWPDLPAGLPETVRGAPPPKAAVSSRAAAHESRLRRGGTALARVLALVLVMLLLLPLLPLPPPSPAARLLSLLPQPTADAPPAARPRRFLRRIGFNRRLPKVAGGGSGAAAAASVSSVGGAPIRWLCDASGSLLRAYDSGYYRPLQQALHPPTPGLALGRAPKAMKPRRTQRSR